MIVKNKTATLVSRILICLIMLAGAIISLGAVKPVAKLVCLLYKPVKLFLSYRCAC